MQDRIAIHELPELDTAVAAYGAQEQREIGGEICVNIAVAIMLIQGA